MIALHFTLVQVNGKINLPDVSLIKTKAEFTLPIIILLVSKSVEFIERVKDSVLSKMVSLRIVTLKVTSVSPAVITTLCGPES